MYDASSVRKVCKIIAQRAKPETLIVVSAFGKTTNGLELLVRSLDRASRERVMDTIYNFHAGIIMKLFGLNKRRVVSHRFQTDFRQLTQLVLNYSTDNYDKRYDQIVSMGEIMSSHIISSYLNACDIANEWLDARLMIRTNKQYREAKVDFAATKIRTVTILKKAFEVKPFALTQGFIGKTKGGITTLGREGSDYSAAIFGYCCNAESVTIWKDVPGILNSDPKQVKNTVPITRMNYQDALELAYYGAKVIHPNTIKPLQNKGIPLYVKSYLNPEAEGTLIDSEKVQLPVPCYIIKKNQVLVSISPKDFSFMGEENLKIVFELLARFKIKLNVMQNSALNFSICMDESAQVSSLFESLNSAYRVLYNKGVELVTIRYYDQPTIHNITKGRAILLEQRSRYTVQLVLK
jgi:aspartate kinase